MARKPSFLGGFLALLPGGLVYQDARGWMANYRFNRLARGRRATAIAYELHQDPRGIQEPILLPVPITVGEVRGLPSVPDVVGSVGVDAFTWVGGIYDPVANAAGWRSFLVPDFGIEANAVLIGITMRYRMSRYFRRAWKNKGAFEALEGLRSRIEERPVIEPGTSVPSPGQYEPITPG